MNTLRVALNLHGLSAHGLIDRAKQIHQTMNDNISHFPNCVSPLARVAADIAELEQSLLDAVDGGKTKTAIKNDKEVQLRESLTLLKGHVEEAANGDPAKVHLASMEVRPPGGNKPQQEFTISSPADGSVLLKTKPVKDAIYKWAYCADPLASNNWVQAGNSKASRFTITGLAPGMYWFKVTYIDDSGEREEAPKRYAVN